MTRTTAAVLAAVVLLAGCTGAVAPGGDGAAGDGTAGDAAAADVGGTGTVNFYVSDERNAIGDFEHLNVTITKVGFHEAGGDGDEEADEGEVGENESEDEETATGTPTDTSTTAAGTDEADDDDGEWREYDVDSKRVDLTELKGENATLLQQFELENGTYDTVFVYVSEVSGTLENGEQVDVKLPSRKLHVNKRFTVGNNESVDFVYDITVVKAGNSGKYIIKPVVSQSGTDVPIKEVAEDGGEGDLGARFVGEVRRGEAVTVKVTDEGGPVANATVAVNGEEYRTGGDGTVTFDVPQGVEELEVEVEHGDAEAELKRTFGGEDRGNSGDRGNDGQGNNQVDARQSLALR